jgi:D-tagatose-1,6-bisphosphate aldolase subunit GatZ/KbaZ
MAKNLLWEMIEKRNRGTAAGVYSACTANPTAIEACMRRSASTNGPVVIEATANQVNQCGGYTGMQARDFAALVYTIGEHCGLAKNRIVLGGDHLGPLPWRQETEAEAMNRATELIRSFVLAGFSKIHIDTSMHLGTDDQNKPLGTRVVAQRAAELAGVVADAHAELKELRADIPFPVLVLGSEVPIPGGSQHTEAAPPVTRSRDFAGSLEEFRVAFVSRGLDEAWDNVMAFVVQPGVEFGDETIHRYEREAARDLTRSLMDFEGLVFEGHSTDYQHRKHLREMVEDGIAVLKVGPALTFALREALFALESIEQELFGYSFSGLSRFSDTLEREMIGQPVHWQNHYSGEQAALRLKRRFSYSDRCRYYLPRKAVVSATKTLFDNLSKSSIPLPLLSQFLPLQYRRVVSGALEPDPRELVLDHVGDCVDDYLFAVGEV